MKRLGFGALVVSGLLVFVMSSVASATVAVRVVPSSSVVVQTPFGVADRAIHESTQDDYIVEACYGDNDNAMSFSTGGMPVSPDAKSLVARGDRDRNGCLRDGPVKGMSIGGTGGGTVDSNVGVKGTYSLTAPAGTSITGLAFSNAYFHVGSKADGVISGWYGELANNSDGRGLLPAHDPTQSHTGYKHRIRPTEDCVTQSPSRCSVTDRGARMFVFNAVPWTAKTYAAPALQKVGFGFECRSGRCRYDDGGVWADVGSALFQLHDPMSTPVAGPSSGGQASFDGHGASAAGGWLAADQVEPTTFTTAIDPAGICSLSVGLYNSSGAPVDVDQDSALETPSLDPSDGYYTSSDPCSDAGRAATMVYTPSAGALAKLQSGIYYLNAVASDPSGYERGQYSWYSGGLSNSATSALNQGIPVKIDNTEPTVTITPGVVGWANDEETQTIAVTGQTGPSGLTSLTCTDNSNAIQPATTTTGADTQTNTYEVSGVGTDTFNCRVSNGVGVSGSGSRDVTLPALTQYGSSPAIDNGQDPYSKGPSQTAWYRTPQSITITASKSSGSDITAITCTGAGTGTTYDNTTIGLSESVQLNIQPPGGQLDCTTSDAAGDTFPLGTYRFNIDDTSPTGTFEAQDPADPALVRVQAVSSGAPIAKVEITFTCKSGPCITANGAGGPFPIKSEPAVLDGQDGDWGALIPDTGRWPNGDYALSASITDAAGNVGVASRFDDGDSAAISLPARVQTTVAATLSADGKTAATETNQVTPGAGSTAAPAVATARRHRAPDTITLRFGTTAILRGVLRDRRSGRPIKHARVFIYRRLTIGGRLTKIGSARTNDRGRFVYRLKAGPSRRIVVAYHGTRIMHPASGSLTEHFRGRVRIAGPKRAIAGRFFVITGRVDGSDLPRNGVLVQPRYRLKGLGGGWAPFGSAVTTGRDGRFTIRIHLAKAAAGLTYLLDVRVQSQFGYAYMTAVSETLLRHVARQEHRLADRSRSRYHE